MDQRVFDQLDALDHSTRDQDPHAPRSRREWHYDRNIYGKSTQHSHWGRAEETSGYRGLSEHDAYDRRNEYAGQPMDVETLGKYSTLLRPLTWLTQMRRSNRSTDGPRRPTTSNSDQS